MANAINMSRRQMDSLFENCKWLKFSTERRSSWSWSQIDWTILRSMILTSDWTQNSHSQPEINSATHLEEKTIQIIKSRSNEWPTVSQTSYLTSAFLRFSEYPFPVLTIRKTWGLELELLAGLMDFQVNFNELESLLHAQITHTSIYVKQRLSTDWMNCGSSL